MHFFIEVGSYIDGMLDEMEVEIYDDQEQQPEKATQNEGGNDTDTTTETTKPTDTVPNDNETTTKGAFYMRKPHHQHFR